jgi:hypothetical protein
MDVDQIKIYAAKSYINNMCVSREEFEADYKTFIYFKNALSRYAATNSEQSIKIALNHLIRLMRCFTTPCINNVALYYLRDEKDNLSTLKTILHFMSIETAHAEFDKCDIDCKLLNTLDNI